MCQNWLKLAQWFLSLIHISEPTRPLYISYAVFCLKKTINFHQCDLPLHVIFLMIRRPPRSTHCISSAASDVYKRQVLHLNKLESPSPKDALCQVGPVVLELSLIHISEPTRPLYIAYAVFCLKKGKATLVDDQQENSKHSWMIGIQVSSNEEPVSYTHLTLPTICSV